MKIGKIIALAALTVLSVAICFVRRNCKLVFDESDFDGFDILDESVIM